MKLASTSLAEGACRPPAPGHRTQEGAATCGSDCEARSAATWQEATAGFISALLPGLAHSTDRAPVTLHLDGIVQVLNCHLSDMAIGMMTRIAVLKWLYHLYIKTPRKVSPWAHQPGRPVQAGGCFWVHLSFLGLPMLGRVLLTAVLENPDKQRSERCLRSPEGAGEVHAVPCDPVHVESSSGAGVGKLMGVLVSLLSRCSGTQTASSPSCFRHYRMNLTR